MLRADDHVPRACRGRAPRRARPRRTPQWELLGGAAADPAVIRAEGPRGGGAYRLPGGARQHRSPTSRSPNGASTASPWPPFPPGPLHI